MTLPLRYFIAFLSVDLRACLWARRLTGVQDFLQILFLRSACLRSSFCSVNYSLTFSHRSSSSSTQDLLQPITHACGGLKKSRVELKVVLFPVRSERNRGGGGVVSNGHLTWGRIVYILELMYLIRVCWLSQSHFKIRGDWGLCGT